MRYQLVRYAASAQGQPPAPPALMSLRSPANVDGTTNSSAYGVIQYANPPALWGVDNGGWTIFRKIKPRATVGYVAQIWHTDDSSFGDSWQFGAGYWGFHPYPATVPRNSATTYNWEIATDEGGDFINSIGGNPIAVTLDRWYYQAMQITRASATSKTLRFWTDLEDISDDTIIEHTITLNGYGDTPAPQPMITMFNSPWMGTYQEERGACDLDWILMYTPYHDVATILANAASFTDPDDIVDYAGTTDLWYGMDGFTTIDGTANELQDKYTAALSFTRNDSSSILSVVSR